MRRTGPPRQRKRGNEDYSETREEKGAVYFANRRDTVHVTATKVPNAFTGKIMNPRVPGREMMALKKKGKRQHHGWS